MILVLRKMMKRIEVILFSCLLCHADHCFPSKSCFDSKVILPNDHSIWLMSRKDDSLVSSSTRLCYSCFVAYVWLSSLPWNACHPSFPMCVQTSLWLFWLRMPRIKQKKTGFKNTSSSSNNWSSITIIMTHRREQLELQHPVLLSLLFNLESWELPESGKFSRWTKCMTQVLPRGRDNADRVTFPWRNRPTKHARQQDKHVSNMSDNLLTQWVITFLMMTQSD